VKKMKCNFWVLILGFALQWVMAGCSSQLETTILSEKAPPEPEVTQVQEEPVATPPEPVVSETKVGEQDLGTPPSEIPVEKPSSPIIRPRTQEKAIEPPPPVAPVVGGIPPVMFDPEMPPQPTMRGGAPKEMAMLEPEPVKVPEKGKVVPPVRVTPHQRPPGLDPFMVDPELPADPSLREGGPAEIAKPVEEKPLEVVKVQPVAPAMPIKTLADVYFDYDRFSLRDVDKNKLNDNAQLLVNQLSGQKVVIEGHCDERGTESYNMILGKRRAETVKKFLVDLGVPEENLEVISFGKERPFCTAHSLECWQENRRGHFVVR
jgi:peptidoglycan-associated lipoprotein